MSLITLTSLSKSYGAVDLFSNLNLSIPRGARMALVGPNGVGKTTLLRIMVAQDEASSGKITRARNLQMGYLPQEADFSMQGTLWDACLKPFNSLISRQSELNRLETQLAGTHTDKLLAQYGKLQEDFERQGGYTYINNIKQVLTGLGFSEVDFGLSLEHLSGGQRTRAFLGQLLLSKPDLLLLDEPTNHLDISAVEWLEGYLAHWEGAAVVVSHDRYFLDRACNAILEMLPSGFEVYHGNYTAYLHQRQERADRRQMVFDSEREKLMKEVEYIKRNISGQNVQQAKGKLRRLTRIVQAIEQVGLESVLDQNWSQLDVQSTTSPFSVAEAERRVRGLRSPVRNLPKLNLNLGSNKRSGDLVLRTTGLKIGYPGRHLFNAPDIELRRGECAALIGPNGAGKTTFLKTILAQIDPLAGEVVMGASLHLGYFAQAHEGLDPDRSVFDEIASIMPAWLPGQVREYAGRYLFSGEDAFKKVSMLSGGERGRLALAKLALQDTNLLLLDEPTNHLDVPSQEILQTVLDEYHGTILLVTHDRYLIDALATQVWEIDPEEAHMSVFKGTYSQLIQEREKLLKPNAEIVGIGRKKSRLVRSGLPERREERKKLARLQELENSIAAHERQLAELGESLQSPSPDPVEVARLGEEYVRVQQLMDEKIREWEDIQS
jgi:ATP-binding cassette subfamily F protein 3